MSFDMNQCKKGDKLVCRDGVVAEYVGKQSHHLFTHKIMVKDLHNDWQMSTTNTGECFHYKTSSHDIIGFYKEEEQMIERNKEYDLKVTGEQLAWLHSASYLAKDDPNVFTTICSQFPTMERSRNPYYGIGWDVGRFGEIIKINLNNLFKTPETEKEKNLRELKEKHEELGKAIQKLEQSN